MNGRGIVGKKMSLMLFDVISTVTLSRGKGGVGNVREVTEKRWVEFPMCRGDILKKNKTTVRNILQWKRPKSSVIIIIIIIIIIISFI